jgi:hypothetical protein
MPLAEYERNTAVCVHQEWNISHMCSYCFECS